MSEKERVRPGLVIFDCDGVLIDSELLSHEVFAEELGKIGLAVSMDEVLKKFVGRSRITATVEIESEYGVRLPPGFWDTVRASVFKRYETNLKAIPGVKDLVVSLSAKKCVASGSGPQTLRRTLGLVGLWEAFAPNVFSSHEVERGKPAPDLFLYASERMRTPPSACLVIEDSVAGVRAARAADMRVLGFAGASHCGPGHTEILRKEGAENAYENMADLAAAIRSIMA
ncbi:MAG: HAD-IA family hydrolase [Alphaproteobacteria bacterium]|nr:HAD-IA family hydrolase [Alphaproteobacteria bacterium]